MTSLLRRGCVCHSSAPSGQWGGRTQTQASTCRRLLRAGALSPLSTPSGFKGRNVGDLLKLISYFEKVEVLHHPRREWSRDNAFYAIYEFLLLKVFWQKATYMARVDHFQNQWKTDVHFSFFELQFNGVGCKSTTKRQHMPAPFCIIIIIYFRNSLWKKKVLFFLS